MTLIFEKFFEKVGLFRFCENFGENRRFRFLRKFWGKIFLIFAKIFAKTKNFRETKFREISRKSAHFRMIFAFSR
jgi:hypothetical protein